MTAGWNRRAVWQLIVACAAFTGCSPHAPEGGLPVLPMGGDFRLVDHDSRPFELATLRGKVVLVFFGYSSCPDACPTTLSKLAMVSRRLGEDRSRLKALYISVDPQRDTPSVLKADLANFDLDALGLTGTKAQIDEVVRQFGASYSIVPTPGSAAPYTVAHSVWLYALDTRGRVRIRFEYDAAVDEIVQGIRTILGEEGARSQ